MRIHFSYLVSFLCILTFGVSPIYAQEDSEKADLDQLPYVSVKAQKTNEGNVLRWGPSTPELWLETNRMGYTIFRAEIAENENISEPEFIELATVKPLDNQVWFSSLSANNENKYPHIAWECIYGKYETLELRESVGASVRKADELSNRYTFALFAAEFDANAAELSGLRYLDRSAKSDGVYIYRVMPNISEDSDLAFSDGSVLVNDNMDNNPAIRLSIITGDQTLTLKWDKKSAEKAYAAYFIERSTDGKNFQRLNKLPYAFGTSKDREVQVDYISYTDSIKNYTPYVYRVAGINSFAEYDNYSNLVAGMARDLTPPEPPNDFKAEHVEGSTIKMTWLKSMSDDLEGYNIYRGQSDSDRFIKLNQTVISRNSTSYVDEYAIEYDRNFYYITAIDTAGNEAKSNIVYGQIIDKTPPSIPLGLTGTVDSSGNVFLKWNRNPEFDIMGYKVFFANSGSHDFNLLTGNAIRDTFYQHKVTLKTLSRNIYYKVMAVDRNYNYSKRSEYIELNRPDTIPPAQPLFKKYDVDEEGIHFTWAKSNSSDLSHHEIQRKDKSSDWKLVKKVQGRSTNYSDNQIDPGIKYQYRLYAVDLAGLKTQAPKDLVIKSFDKLLTESVKSLSVSKNEKDQVTITWDHKSNDDFEVVIYRMEVGKAMNVLKTLSKTERIYIDKTANKDKSYQYTAKVNYSNGKKSKYYSPLVSLNAAQ